MALTPRALDAPTGYRPLRDATSEIKLASAAGIEPQDRAFLLQLQRRAIEYFLDNQVSSGLVLDRQRNHEPPIANGLCSTAATGMGFIAIALATAAPHHLLSRRAAILRIRAGLRLALHGLPHAHGILPHFIDSATNEVHGADCLSTVDSAWLIAGALWAAAFLADAQLEDMAASLYGRIHWNYWAAPGSAGEGALIRHGMGWNGRFLHSCWDRLNGETAFMYVLATGAERSKAIDEGAWRCLRAAYGTVAGLRFHSADLGLFVFQYGLDLLDLDRWKAPEGPDLAAEAQVATLANYRASRQAAAQFATYQRYWGLSAGDGPGDSRTQDTYRCYAPLGPMDGTAHIMATAASIAHMPQQILANLREAQHDRELQLLGRYGFSSVNVDRRWRARDMVGIDAGAALLAIDNMLFNNRVRAVFHSLEAVRNGLERMCWTQSSAQNKSAPHTALRMAS